MQDLFNEGQILGRSEMRKIMAGSGSGSCTITCQDGTQEDADDCKRKTVEDTCGGDAVGATCAGPLSQCG